MKTSTVEAARQVVEDICHADEVTVFKVFGMIPISGEL